MGLNFSVHKVAKVSSNNCKLHSEVLLHSLRYIRYNKALGLNYYDGMKYATLPDLLRQANI